MHDTPHGDDNTKGSQDPGRHPSLSLFSSNVAKQFAKKMGEVEKKEFEVKAMRFADKAGVPHIDLDKFPVSQLALKQIPRDDATRLGAVCFFVDQDEIRIGALDPTNAEVAALLATLEKRDHVNGKLYTISEKSLERVLDLYNTLPIIKPITKDVEIHESDLANVQATVNDFASFQELVQDKGMSDLVTVLLGAGLKLDASDVHIETEENGIVVRLRLDGILHDAARLPKEIFQRLVSRIKLVSGLKINITDKPQDGRFTIRLSNGDVDVRVSTMPTVYGESVVLRLLRQNQEGITLEGLGLRERAYDILAREIRRPNGMIITTGPTGSGKTTTLYAILKILNKPGVKIITLEDPVEYRIEGVNQSQIEHSKDYTFAKGLRSLLRQDPDIVMVGEIRDLETANIAIDAALTGHMMLSTLHTNNAIGAVSRFLSMGVKSFLLDHALNAVLGQRLVRRICVACHTMQPIDAYQQSIQDQIHELIDAMPEDAKKEIAGKPLVFPEPKGCTQCNNIGYKGRIGVYEIFPITAEVADMIHEGSFSEHDMAALLREQGMVTMAQDGIVKAIDGTT